MVQPWLPLREEVLRRLRHAEHPEGRHRSGRRLARHQLRRPQAEEILDELGELEEHYYIRDFHEAGMINWYEIDMSEIEELDEPNAVYDEYDDEDIDIDDVDDFPDDGDSDYGAPEELDFEDKD